MAETEPKPPERFTMRDAAWSSAHDSPSPTAAEPGSAPSKREVRRVERNLSASAARSRITNIAGAGIACMVLGLVLAIAEQPSTTIGPFGGVEHHGDQGGYAFGLIVSGVGYTLFLIAVIAWGVMLGNRASQDR